MWNFQVAFVLCVFTIAFSKPSSKGSSSKASSKGSSKESVTPKPKPAVEVTAAALYEHEEKVVTLVELPCGTEDILSVKSVKSNTRSKPQCAICFQIYHGSYDNYELRFLPLDVVDYTRDQSYIIKLDCRDQQNLVLKQLTVVVRIEPNTPPYFHILHEKETKSLFEMSQEGLSVNRCTDDDISYGDYLTYTLLSVSPPSSSFFITREGVIHATGDLRGLCHSPVTFEVMCEDRFEHLAPEPLTMQLTLKDSNKAPVVGGLNKALEVPEDMEDGTTLAQFTVEEAGTDPLCSLSALPFVSLQYFQLYMSGTQGEIRVQTRLNYEEEEIRHTNLTVTCSDGFCSSTEAYLYVITTDVNEPVTLLPKDVTLKVYEGYIAVDPNWIPTDEDNGDDPIYTIASGNIFGRFVIDPNTGVISSTVEYDIDGQAMPVRDTLVVQVEDEGGHVSSSTVMLTILDSNDNRPVFPTDIVTVLTDNCTYTIGRVIGNISATDIDSSFQGNNAITYSGNSGVITIRDNGNMILEGSAQGGQSYTVQVTATDSGQFPGPLVSAFPAIVTVNVTDCPPTTPTTTTTQSTTLGQNTLVSAKENWWWIALSSLLTMVVVTAVAAVLWRFCSPVRNAGRNVGRCSKDLCGYCCQPRRRLSLTTVRPTVLGHYRNNRPKYEPSGSTQQSVVLNSMPVFRTQSSLEGIHLSRNPPKNGNKGFWRERFLDDEDSDRPSRNRTLSPPPVEAFGPLFAGTWRSRAV